MKRRVAVVAVGAVTPLGGTANSTWLNLLGGRSGVQRLLTNDGEDWGRVRIAGLVSAFSSQSAPGYAVEGPSAHALPKFMRYAHWAAHEAVQSSGLHKEELRQAGVVFGTGIGGLALTERTAIALRERGSRRGVRPHYVMHSLPSSAAGYVSIQLGCEGPMTSPSSACAAGAQAIGEAYRLVSWGECDLAVAGASEACVTPLAMAGFDAMGALAQMPENSGTEDEVAVASLGKPFDQNRGGFVLAEGAAAVVLEEWTRAKQRGARILAELVGYGSAGDAHHLAAPHPEGAGAERAIRSALRDAGLAPAQVDYVNAHATGTLAGDLAEVRALERVFGGLEHKGPAIASTKGATGHLLGAAGALEAVFAALSVHHGRTPATRNLRCIDPAFPNLRFLHHGCDGGYQPLLRTSLSTSLAFGGINAALVFQKVDS